MAKLSFLADVTFNWHLLLILILKFSDYKYCQKEVIQQFTSYVILQKHLLNLNNLLVFLLSKFGDHSSCGHWHLSFLKVPFELV